MRPTKRASVIIDLPPLFLPYLRGFTSRTSVQYSVSQSVTSNETDFPAQQPASQAHTWFPRAHGHPRRASCNSRQTRQRQTSPVGLIQTAEIALQWHRRSRTAIRPYSRQVLASVGNPGCLTRNSLPVCSKTLNAQQIVSGRCCLCKISRPIRGSVWRSPRKRFAKQLIETG